MIAQFVNENFLLGAAEDTRLELKRLVEQRERRQPVDAGPLSDVTNEEIREVVDELNRVVGELDAKPVRDPKDDWMCMPREPILAILQTELTRAARAAADKRRDVIVGDPLGPTERRIADADERTGEGRRAFGKYEITRPIFLSDPRWLWAGVVIAWHKFKHKAAFGGVPEQAITIADDARILLVGDWGSGLERAQAVAQRMRQVLLQGLAEGREQHVVHLGDVYYTGAEEEYEQNFLAHWPVRQGEEISSYTLCGNHDMYRGGHAYYGTALTDARFARQRGKSVFALRSSGWQLLGLDTGYEDKMLAGRQAGWIADQLGEVPGVRTALLSHHQLWSAYEDAGEELRSGLEEILATGKVDAWFWAHEHRCLSYDPWHGVGFASCVGHGGIPEYLVAAEGEAYPAGLRYEYRQRYGNGIEPWNTFGFAVIDLKGRGMTIRYFDEHGGEPHHREELRG